MIDFAARSNFPHEVIRSRNPAYQVARRDLVDLSIVGLGKVHPTVLAAQQKIGDFRKELYAALEPIRGELEANPLLLNEPSYVNASQDYETDLRLLQEMKANRAKTKAELSE